MQKCIFCQVCRLYSIGVETCNSSDSEGRRCGRYRELKNLTKAAMIFGDSILVAVAILALWVFSSIETQGYFRAIEANQSIIFLEVTLAILGLFYGVMIWVSRIYKYARYEVTYQGPKKNVD
jgi:hypothetical protein